MTKVKHRDRKQQKTLSVAKTGGDYAKSPSLEANEARQSENTLMPVTSTAPARKKEKRYGHN